MIRKMKLVFAALVVGVAAAVYAATVKCPIDSMYMSWTGKTQTEMGRLLHQYKCPNGHVSWVTQ